MNAYFGCCVWVLTNNEIVVKLSDIGSTSGDSGKYAHLANGVNT